MDKEEVNLLIERLEGSIEAIDKKYQVSGEDILNDYLKKYQAALDALRSGSSDAGKRLKKLKNCARGYLETSSDYDQEFLREMGETEKIIKSIAP